MHHQVKGAALAMLSWSRGGLGLTLIRMHVASIIWLVMLTSEAADIPEGGAIAVVQCSCYQGSVTGARLQR